MADKVWERKACRSPPVGEMKNDEAELSSAESRQKAKLNKINEAIEFKRIKDQPAEYEVC